MTTAVQQRLNARTLADARARARPTYDRAGTPVIAHLGFGAFARAHLALYADDLLRQGRPALIRAVSIKSAQAQEQLEPQDGLFTVAVREPGEELNLQVVGSLSSIQTGPAAALAAVTAPSTRLVTLTITEKGYGRTSGDTEEAASVPALIVSALQHCRRTRQVPPVFASLDNLHDNGRILREGVLHAAERVDPSLVTWIADSVQFPSSVVDRMVPAPTGRDRDEISERLGLIDEAAVGAERHRSWIIRSVDGLEALGEVGVELVDDVAPFERRKLWLLNGLHSAAAYGGLLAGCATIADAVADPRVAPFVRHLLRDTLEVAAFPAALEPAAFAEQALRRFANPALGHTCVQVGTDGSSKLPQRLLPVVAAGREHGLATERFAVVAAIWIAAAAGMAVRGARLPALADPIAEALQQAARRATPRELSHLALGDTPFTSEVGAALERLATHGLSVLEVAP
jgi:fructuronate reductase